MPKLLGNNMLKAKFKLILEWFQIHLRGILGAKPPQILSCFHGPCILQGVEGCFLETTVNRRFIAMTQEN